VRKESSLIAVALAALFGGSACSHATMPPSYARSALAPVGPEFKPLPDFQRHTLEGGSIDTKELRGKIVVVKFFAKYCDTCKQSLPWMERFAQEHPSVTVIGVAEDERESDAREVTASYKLSFPVVHDAGNVLSGRYRVSDMPITFVADKKGLIRWVGGPGQSEQELAQAVASSSD
jgi:peroxiredoxin